MSWTGFPALSTSFPVFRLQSAFAKKTPSPRRRKRYEDVTGFHYQLHASSSVSTERENASEQLNKSIVIIF